MRRVVALLITLSLVMVLAADCGGESSLVGEQGPDASSDDATTPDARTPTADAASCGGAQEACCNETACDSGLACVEGMCVPVCGGAGQDCCKATACNNGLACVGGKCAVPTAEGGVCGASAEPCCNGTACNAGLACTYGVCVPPCGSHGAACCNGTACNNGLVCDAGTCVALPDASVDVATDVVDAGAVTQPWALSFGQSPGSWMSGVAVDSSANVLVGGSVGWGALVEKLDSAGNPKWQKQLANSGVQSVAFDAQGNAFAGGSGSASTDFGGGPLGSGEFLVKFDAQGNVLWQRGGYQASFACLAVRPNGNVVAVGSLTGPADFGGGPITPTNSKVLVVEFTASNQYVQAATFGASNGSAYATTCALDSTGAIFLGGNFEESITFGGSTFTGPPQGSGSWNFFLAKLDSSFGHLASMDLKSTGYNSWFGSVAVDANDNLFVVGTFTNTVDLGGGALLSAGGDDLFVGRLDANLGHVWSKRYGDSSGQSGQAVAVAPSGNVLVGGSYGGNMNFGCGPLPSVTSGNPDMYLAVLDPSGGCLSSEGFQGSSGATAAAFLEAPDFVIVGSFSAPLVLPSGTLSGGGSFVARLQP